MAEKSIEITERAEITPNEGGEIILPEGQKPEEKPEGEPAETPEKDEDADKPDELVHNTPTEKPKDQSPVQLKDVSGETPKERALRQKLAEKDQEIRRMQGKDILDKTPTPTITKKELSEDKKKILARYKPEEIQQFREVFDVIAEDMGFAKVQEIGAQSFNDKANDTLESFIDDHPEYKPENDKDGLLWGRFKEEYAMFRPPETVKQLKSMLEKTHREVFGIQPSGDLKAINAAREKVQVASHGGASKPAIPPEKKTSAPKGLRLDMLKGFNDDEKSAIEARASAEE